MKLIVNTIVNKLKPGISLEYEAVEKKSMITVEYSESEVFKELSKIADEIIDVYTNKGYVVTYDNLTTKCFNGKLNITRYIVIREKEDK